MCQFEFNRQPATLLQHEFKNNDLNELITSSFPLDSAAQQANSFLTNSYTYSPQSATTSNYSFSPQSFDSVKLQKDEMLADLLDHYFNAKDFEKPPSPVSSDSFSLSPESFDAWLMLSTQPPYQNEKPTFLNQPNQLPQKQQQICSNCGTNSTPLWRKNSSNMPVCNACGLFESIHHMPRTKARNASKVDYSQLSCSNCKTTSTPTWRKDANKNPLCNACGLQ